MLKRYPVHLPDDERHRLEQLVRACKHTARVLAQVRILLKADEGWSQVRLCSL
jgi:hypothetical protein